MNDIYYNLDQVCELSIYLNVKNRRFFYSVPVGLFGLKKKTGYFYWDIYRESYCEYSDGEINIFVNIVDSCIHSDDGVVYLKPHITFIFSNKFERTIYFDSVDELNLKISEIKTKCPNLITINK